MNDVDVLQISAALRVSRHDTEAILLEKGGQVIELTSEELLTAYLFSQDNGQPKPIPPRIRLE